MSTIQLNPLFLTDGYKCGHHMQYPKGTTLVYSNFTPRSNKYAPKGCEYIVVNSGSSQWGAHKGNCKNPIHKENGSN